MKSKKPYSQESASTPLATKQSQIRHDAQPRTQKAPGRYIIGREEARNLNNDKNEHQFDP